MVSEKDTGTRNQNNRAVGFSRSFSVQSLFRLFCDSGVFV